MASQDERQGYWGRAAEFSGVAAYGTYMGEKLVRGILQSPQIRDRIIEALKTARDMKLLDDESLFGKWDKILKNREMATETVLMKMFADVQGNTKKVLQNTLIIASLPDTVKDIQTLTLHLLDNGVDILEYERLYAMFERKQQKNDDAAATENTLNNLSTTFVKGLQEHGGKFQKTILDQTQAVAPAAISEILKSSEVGEGAARMARNFLESEQLHNGIGAFLDNQQMRVATKGLVQDVVHETIENNVPMFIKDYLPDIVHASVRETGPYVISGIMLLAGVYVGVHKATR